jgi:cell division protein YceG involved in septum cleavage
MSDTPYLYFVSKNDGSHVFAATLADFTTATSPTTRKASIPAPERSRPDAFCSLR